MIYFVQAGDSGAIKIGMTDNVLNRLKNLQTACPEPLKLLCVKNGGPDLESVLHAKFALHRSIGEWFRPVPEILDFIASETSDEPVAIVIRRRKMAAFPDKGLGRYLNQMGISATAFAAVIGRSPSTVTRLCNGETSPDKATMEAIFLATNGAVAPGDWFEMPPLPASESP